MLNAIAWIFCETFKWIINIISRYKVRWLDNSMCVCVHVLTILCLLSRCWLFENVLNRWECTFRINALRRIPCKCMEFRIASIVNDISWNDWKLLSKHLKYHARIFRIPSPEKFQSILQCACVHSRIWSDFMSFIRHMNLMNASLNNSNSIVIIFNSFKIRNFMQSKWTNI